MSTTHVSTPTSRCRFGLATCDITPPVGIYHRFWGAAEHDRATGVHRPLEASVILVGPLESTDDADLQVIVTIDHCLFRAEEMQRLLHVIGDKIGIQPSRIVCLFSHTHAAGNMTRNRAELPGGDLIAPYLDGLPQQIADCYRQAYESLQQATLTYATSSCGMARQRDYWDNEQGHFVCGFNPDHDPTEFPVHVVRVTNQDAELQATLVHYPCHPTTLAWDNTLISPDYIGSLRETMQTHNQAPCVFLLGACGDIGPRDGFVGDTAVADRNGRQLAFAALNAVESMLPDQHDLEYAGPMISGATIGTWVERPFNTKRLHDTVQFRHAVLEVKLPYLEGLPTTAQAHQELTGLLAQEDEARARRDLGEARRLRALAERKRRLIERVEPLPTGDMYPLQVFVWQFGDAFWVAVEGEPYHALQSDLHQRFPGRPVIVIPLANGSRCSYLPTRDGYAKHGLYQVEVALLAAGALETLTDAVSAKIQSWLAD